MTRALVIALATACASTTLGLGPGPVSRAAAAPTDHTRRTVAKAADPSQHTLLAGHALVAGTSRDTLRNGWYSVLTSPGTVEVDETIPVPGQDGPSSASTGTWFRQDPTGRFHSSHDHTRLRLRPTGDLVLITSQGKRLWHSGTAGSGAVRLTLHRRGNLALHTGSGRVVWSSRSGPVQMSGGMSLGPGEQLRDAWETAFEGGRPITLTMQRDGNLVHRDGSRIDWQTHTHVRGSSLRMFRGGALVVVTPTGRTVWSSHSGGHDYAHLNGKHMTIETEDLELVWYAQLD